MDEFVVRSPPQLHLQVSLSPEQQQQARSGRSDCADSAGPHTAQQRTEAREQTRNNAHDPLPSHPPPHAATRRRHALTASDEQQSTAAEAAQAAPPAPRASPKSDAHRSKHALAIDASCESAAAKPGRVSPISVTSAAARPHRHSEATPAPLASPGPIFDLELTTPVPSPSPPPRKESGDSGGSSSGVSLSDFSRRSMSDVDVTSRSSISLGWAAQSTISDGHEGGFAAQHGPAASPYAVASLDPNAAAHAAPRSIHLPVALKTTIDEHGSTSNGSGPLIKFATSDLTAYRSLHRSGAAQTSKSAIGMHFHTMQPPTRSQRDAQAQKPSSSSFAAQQAIRQQLLSAAAASAESAEGAQAAQWEALQDVMSFPPPPPLPLVHPSQLAQRDTTQTVVYPQSTRAPLRTIGGGAVNGAHESHGFYTPNPPASRRIIQPLSGSGATIASAAAPYALDGPFDFDFDFAKPASTTGGGRRMLYHESEANEKQAPGEAATTVVLPRHSSEAEKELQCWESQAAQRSALNRRSVRAAKIEAEAARSTQTQEEDAGMFEMDL